METPRLVDENNNPVDPPEVKETLQVKLEKHDSLQTIQVKQEKQDTPEVVTIQVKQEKQENVAEKFQVLFSEIESSLEKLGETLSTNRDIISVKFAELTSEIEAVVSESNSDKYECGIEEKRASMLRQLQDHIKVYIGRVRSDIERNFQIRAMAPRERLRSYKQKHQGSIDDYLDKKAMKFSSETKPLVGGIGGYHGRLAWKETFDCMKYTKYSSLLYTRVVRTLYDFKFCGRLISLGRSSSNQAALQKNRNLRFAFEFQVMDCKGVVRSKHPLWLFFDIFRPETNVYTYGQHMVITKDLGNIYTKQMYTMLKKMSSSAELPDFKTRAEMGTFYIGVIDQDFTLTKEFLSAAAQEPPIICSQSMELLNDKGIVISKKYPKPQTEEGHNKPEIDKCQLSFYDYKLKPIFLDFTLPESEKASRVVRFRDGQLYLVNFIDLGLLRLTIFNIETHSYVKTQMVPLTKKLFYEPINIMLDSKDNLIIVSRPQYVYYACPYVVTCVNLNTDEIQCDQPNMTFWNYRDSYLNENDEVVIVTKDDFMGHFMHIIMTF